MQLPSLPLKTSSLLAMLMDKLSWTPSSESSVSPAEADNSVIGGDEATHQTVLESVLSGAGQSASDVNTCSFGFDAALADVQTFVATAQALELVGVAA